MRNPDRMFDGNDLLMVAYCAFFVGFFIGLFMDGRPRGE